MPGLKRIRLWLVLRFRQNTGTGVSFQEGWKEWFLASSEETLLCILLK